MKRTATALVSALLPLVAGVCIATSASAQPATNDEAYCQSLVKEYKLGGMARGSLPQSLETAVAIAQCQEGNLGPAIPVLQEKLRGNGFDVPSRP